MATLLGLPIEIRLQILQYLLLCDKVLADVPDVVANTDDPCKTLLSNNSDLATYKLPKYEEWDSSFDAYSLPDSSKEKFVSRCRFKLYPAILRTCRQLYDEGFPLLYDCTKTIEISYLLYFNLFQPPSAYDSRSYCMGTYSIKAAFEKWPALRRFRNWAYTIYIGPFYRGYSFHHRWDPREEDVDALSSISINKMTISFLNTSHHGLTRPEDKVIFGASILPFHVLYCQSATILGLVPSGVVQDFFKYLVQKPYRSMLGYRSDIIKLDNEIERYMKCCQTLKKIYGNEWRHELDPMRRELQLTIMTWNLRRWYLAVKLTLEKLDEVLFEAELLSNDCNTWRGCYSTHDSQMVKNFYRTIEILRQQAAGGVMVALTKDVG